MRMTHTRWFGLVAAMAMGLTACEPESPTAPELGRHGIETTTEEATAEAAIGASGQLFFNNDAGLTRSYPGSPCQVDPAYRDFDFWLGEWNVTENGAQAGTNHILSLLDGCLVEENWTGAGGGQGRSMNAYDAATGTWSQYWMDQFGLHLRLEGGVANGAMSMQGPRAIPSGGFAIDRITWTPQPNGDVNQFWEVSQDGGATFPITVFDGDYVLTPGVVPAPPFVSDFCTNAEYGQLDFLVGDWIVTKSSGQAVGSASVRVDMQGCMLEQDFATDAGYASQSFMAWDWRTETWYRNYVDAEGVRLRMNGGLAGGAMVFETTRPSASGGELGIRVTLTPDGADRVIEQWATSSDGSAWKDGLTAVYERA